MARARSILTLYDDISRILCPQLRRPLASGTTKPRRMAMRGLALAIMIIACPSCMALVHPPQHKLGAAERAVVAPLGASTGAVVSQQLHRTRAATAGAGGTLEPLRGGGGLGSPEARILPRSSEV